MSLLLFAAGAAQAQDPGSCPQLPGDTDLTWEHRGMGESDFCRALRSDGSEAFGMYISNEAAFDPKRGNREEADVINGQEIRWYRAELVGQPDVEARETLVELNDGRTAHIWLQAGPGEQLDKMFQLARGLDFSSRPIDTIAAEQ
ncbi:hypothetical protein [Lysobacter sp. A289]